MTVHGITQKSLDEAYDLLEYNELLMQDALIPRGTMNSQDFIDICSSMRTYVKELDALCSLNANVKSTMHYIVKGTLDIWNERKLSVCHFGRPETPLVEFKHMAIVLSPVARNHEMKQLLGFINSILEIYTK